MIPFETSKPINMLITDEMFSLLKKKMRIGTCCIDIAIFDSFD